MPVFPPHEHRDIWVVVLRYRSKVFGFFDYRISQSCNFIMECSFKRGRSIFRVKDSVFWIVGTICSVKNINTFEP